LSRLSEVARLTRCYDLAGFARLPNYFLKLTIKIYFPISRERWSLKADYQNESHSLSVALLMSSNTKNTVDSFSINTVSLYGQRATAYRNLRWLLVGLRCGGAVK